MSQRKWLFLLTGLSVLAILSISIFIFQLKAANERIKVIQEEQLTSYESIEAIMYYNVERANAIRGLLAYEDRHFLEMYYSLSQRSNELKRSIAKEPYTPSSLLDLLDRDRLWEREADRVLVIYEAGDTKQATAVAETMTEQRQTILEDLRALKSMQYKEIRNELVAAEHRVSSLTQALFTIGFLLIAVSIILTSLLIKLRLYNEPLE